MIKFCEIRKYEQFPDRISRDIHERRKLRLLSRSLYKAIGNLKQQFSVSPEEIRSIFKYVSLSQRIFALSKDEPRQTTWSNIKGMCDVIMFSYTTQTPIRFVSVASNALDVHGAIRVKDQYMKFDRILKILECCMVDMPPYTYEVFLADMDYRFDLLGYEDSWSNNFSYLQRSTVVPSRRLSEAFSDFKCLINAVNEANGQDFDREVSHLEKSGTLMLFKTDLVRARYQMSLYAAIGLMLQKQFPTGILLDVQRKIYAYEQPYYQRGRILSPIPITRVSHF